MDRLQLYYNDDNAQVWIWRYELSYANSFTFMMPFIGARSRTWQSIIWHNGTMADMVDHYRCTVLYWTVLYRTAES